MFAMSDSYWKYRRAKLAVKRPEFALLDLMLFAGGRNKEEKLPYFERCKHIYQQGQYHFDRSVEMVQNFCKKVKDYFKGPETMLDKSIRLNDKDWGDIDRSEAMNKDGVNRSEANLGEDSGPEFYRRDATDSNVGRPRRFADDINVTITPESTENQIKSERVGPEGQIPYSSEPFPLAKPDPKDLSGKRDPFAIEDHRTAEEKAKNDASHKDEGKPLQITKDDSPVRDEDGKPNASKPVASAQDKSDTEKADKDKSEKEKTKKKRRADRDDFEL